jgi:hypothetical protein
MQKREFSDQSFVLAGKRLRIQTDGQERDELPSEAELLATLGELSELLGAARCARAYQLHSPEDLPDGWEAELVDQRALIRRLLRYAGKDDHSFPVRVTDGRHVRSEDLGDHLAGNLAYVGVTDTGQAAADFLVLELGDFRAMLGPTCVEVARALIHRARIDAKAQSYRELEPLGVEIPTELEGFLACFALGWGVPVTNACCDPRSVGSGLAGSAWIAASLSYPPELAARLLAIVYQAGAQPKAVVDTRMAALNPSQRELFAAAHAELAAHGASLRAVLRWEPIEDWPAPVARALDELEFDAHDEALEAADQTYAARKSRPYHGAVVFRARPKRTLAGAIVGGFLGSVLGSGLGWIIGIPLGAWIGSRLRGSSCSGPRCGAPLDADARECSNCGGTVGGEIDSPKHHLAALEDYERKHVGSEPANVR